MAFKEEQLGECKVRWTPIKQATCSEMLKLSVIDYYVSLKLCKAAASKADLLQGKARQDYTR